MSPIILRIMSVLSSLIENLPIPPKSFCKVLYKIILFLEPVKVMRGFKTLLRVVFPPPRAWQEY